MNMIAQQLEAAVDPRLDSIDWPPLQPFEKPELPRLDPGLIPSWAGEFTASLAASTETPPELAAAMVLAACSTACARRFMVQVKPGYSEPTNLWLAAALPPGNRKSTVERSATSPISEWERNQSELLKEQIIREQSERKTLESRAQSLRQKAAKAQDPDEAQRFGREAADIEAELPEIASPPQLWTSDSTPEKLGDLLAKNGETIAWLSAEGGLFDLLAGRYSEGKLNLDLVLKAWSGDAERVDRVGRPPINLAQPLMTIGMAPQPDVLSGQADRPGFRGRGLLGRFLYFLPPSPLGYRDLDPIPMPDETKTRYADGLSAMLDWPEAEGGHYVLYLETEAYNEWLEYARTTESMMRPGRRFEHAQDWASKAQGQAIRIAGVLHGIMHAHDKPWEHSIALHTMQNALEIIAVIQKHSLAALDLMGNSDDPRAAGAQKVLNHLRNTAAQQARVRDVYQALRGSFPRMDDLQPALELLQERGYIHLMTEQPEGSGRPSLMLIVRPEGI